MSTKEKLLHIASECERLAGMLKIIGSPIKDGGADDISFAASHQIGVSIGSLHYTGIKLIKLASNLQTNQV